ncbi:MAG: S9 family peptidase [Pseudomonadaceae bacterium]|nr:S9 family peptidase [Pseudomonadaceae bacterium]
MVINRCLLSLLTGLIFCGCLASTYAEANLADKHNGTPTPIDVFAELPPFQSISLSPDGNQAIALRAFQGTYHAVLMDFTSGKSKLLMAADPDNFLFNWCRFANPTRVVCSIRSYIVLRAGTIGLGGRAYRDGRTVATRLLAIDTDGRNQLQLIPEAKSRLGGDLQWNSPNQDDVISWLPDDPKHIMVQVAREDRLHPSVYKLNIYTNELKREQRFLSSIYRWYADRDGELRFATGRTSNGEGVAYSYANGKRTSISISHLNGLDQPTLLTIAPDNKSVYVIANHDGADTQGLYRVAIATGQVIETLFQDTEFDVTRFYNHSPTQQILYAGYNEDGPELTWFNKELQSAIESVSTTLGNPRFVDIWSTTPSLSHFILAAQGNGIAQAVYRYSVADRSLVKLSDFRQGANVKFEYVTYTARDGQIIPAYLALPGPRQNGPYPTIIDPHGGPWSEDDGRYFFLNQYFIDRGYAILKPNFRGSTGYGDAYTAAGFEQWGGLMQDDVIDGLDWMIEQKLTDANKVCIHGGSYGGYVALVAAYKTPEKLRCAISFAGVTDLADLRSRLFNFRFGRLSTARLPKGDALVQNSPIENVEKIQVPLLLVHGDVDRSVMIEQSRNLVDKLVEADIEHQYIEQPNGDHFLSLQAHRLEYLQALEQFLAKHMGD